MNTDSFGARIINDFSYHQPDKLSSSRMEGVRDECLRLALLLKDWVPQGREQSLALTKLEEVMFWSNAGIARGGDK